MHLVHLTCTSLSLLYVSIKLKEDNPYSNEMLGIDVRPMSVPAWPRTRLRGEKAARAHAHRGKSLPCINVSKGI